MTNQNTSIEIGQRLYVGTFSYSAAMIGQTPITYVVQQAYPIDLNGDGIDEVIFAGFETQPNSPEQYTYTKVLIYGWKNGIFQNVTQDWLPGNLSGVEGVGDIAFGDFNGDGKIDVYLSANADMNYSTHEYVLINSGTYFDRFDLGSSIWEHGVASGDINNDGYMDAVVFGYLHPSVFFLGGPSGLTKYTVSVGGSDYATFASGGVIGNFLGNGQKQIVVVDSAIANGPNDSLLLKTISEDGKILGFENIATLPTPLLDIPYSGAKQSHDVRARAFDFNHDGLDDVIVFSRAWWDGKQWPEKSAIQFLLNKGNGEFIDVTNSFIKNYDTNSNICYVPVFKDLNQDGIKDIFVSEGDWSGSNNSTAVLLSQPDGTYSEYGRALLSGLLANSGGMATLLSGPNGQFFLVTDDQAYGGTVSLGIVPLWITNDENAPTMYSAATATTPENVSISHAVYTVTATDPNGNIALTYFISGGVDADQFNINAATGAVTFKTSPNFEVPADAGSNNVYDITVRASNGSKYADQAVAITVTDVNETCFLRTSVILLGTTYRNDIWTISFLGDINKIISYQADPNDELGSGIYNVANALANLIRSDILLGHEYYVIVGENPDGTIGIYLQQLTSGAIIISAAVTDATAQKTPVSISVNSFNTPENISTWATVYTAIGSDLDANTLLTYSIVGGADSALFNINASTGAVTFKASPNYEAPTDAGANNVYDIIVQASDGSQKATQAVAISVTNVNEAPSITSAATLSTPENVSTSTAVYKATAIDPDAGTTLAYSISGGADAALFNINASTGAVTFKASPNFEAPTDAGANNVYDIVVQASDGSLTATKSVAITVTDVQETTTSNLHGMTYFWKPDTTGKHALLSGVTVNASGGAGPTEGSNAPIQVKNIAWDPSGHVTADIYAHITSGMDSFDLNFDLRSGTNAAFTSTMDSTWTLLNHSSASSLLISAYSLTAASSGDVKLGSLAFDVGSAGQAHIGVNGGSDVSFNDVATKSTAFAYDLAHSTTGADGSFTISSVASGSYGLTASRGITDLGNAITSADALAALKIAVAINPNATVNGQQLAVSPFQFMAADANGDGRVTSADALSILKMAVKLPSAITPEWMFVEDTRDFYDDANGVFTLNRSNASWDHTINANVAGDTTENLVGIIKGDVNGSWTPPAGSSYMETLQPSYFTTLANTIHAPISEFGVFG